MLLVLTTMPSFLEAESLAKKLVESRLAACVQILPPMTSIYVWEGAVQKETEHLLLIKSRDEKWDEVREFISANHSYSVPEIVGVDVEKVSEPYRRWLTETLG